MLRASQYTITCDGDEECDAIVVAETRNDAIEQAKEEGWLYNRAHTEHYCIGHTIADRCVHCNRYMYPQRRYAHQFPEDWVQASRFKRKTAEPACHSCERADSTGNLREQQQELEGAMTRYYGSFPLMAKFEGETTAEQRIELAYECLKRYGQEDLYATIVG